MFVTSSQFTETKYQSQYYPWLDHFMMGIDEDEGLFLFKSTALVGDTDPFLHFAGFHTGVSDPYVICDGIFPKLKATLDFSDGSSTAIHLQFFPNTWIDVNDRYSCWRATRVEFGYIAGPSVNTHLRLSGVPFMQESYWQDAGVIQQGGGISHNSVTQLSDATAYPSGDYNFEGPPLANITHGQTSTFSVTEQGGGIWGTISAKFEFVDMENTWVQTKRKDGSAAYAGEYTNLATGAKRKLKYPDEATSALTARKVLMFAPPSLTGDKDGVPPPWAGTDGWASLDWSENAINPWDTRYWLSVAMAMLEREHVIADQFSETSGNVYTLVEDEEKLFDLQEGHFISSEILAVYQKLLFALARYYVDIDKCRNRLQNGETDLRIDYTGLDIPTSADMGFSKGDCVKAAREWLYQAKNLLMRMRYLPVQNASVSCNFDKEAWHNGEEVEVSGQAEYQSKSTENYDQCLADLPSSATKYWNFRYNGNEYDSSFYGLSKVTKIATNPGDPEKFQFYDSIQMNVNSFLATAFPEKSPLPILANDNSLINRPFPALHYLYLTKSSSDIPVGSTYAGGTVTANVYVTATGVPEGYYEEIVSSGWKWNTVRTNSGNLANLGTSEAWGRNGIGDYNPPSDWLHIVPQVPQTGFVGVALWGNRMRCWIYADWDEYFVFNSSDHPENGEA